METTAVEIRGKLPIQHGARGDQGRGNRISLQRLKPKEIRTEGLSLINSDFLDGPEGWFCRFMQGLSTGKIVRKLFIPDRGTGSGSHYRKLDTSAKAPSKLK